jgi:short subunit dehydrogenase-like uncharacterized protein
MSNRNETLIVYGSYGYTGRLIIKECRSRGLKVILSGRNREKLKEQSDESGFPFEVVDIKDLTALKNLLRKGKVVIHCAGPFKFTAREMVVMCLATQTHYTDISGEYQVFEMLAGFDRQAQEANITVMPGTGFDVVPSDCLATHLKRQLPSATKLQLAFTMSGGGLSRGTSRTMVHGLGEGTVVRRNGKITHLPLGQQILEVDFGPFKKTCLNIPWGDVSTAWRSTRIPDIEVYAAVSSASIPFVRMSRYFNWLLKRKWLKTFLLNRVDRKPDGPPEAKIKQARSFLWGQVSDPSGKSATATMETSNGYVLTSRASVLIAERILNGQYQRGYQTPASAYGPDLILEIDHTARRD